MTLRLILTRHAKSDWDDPRQHDHDRTLTERGQAAARAMGLWLAGRGDVPGQALISTATRAVETWEGMAPALPGADAVFHARLYNATPAMLLMHLAQANTPCVLMIAHNPGIAALAEALINTRPEHRDFARYPSTATLIVDFDVTDWRDVATGKGRLVAFAVPRDIME